MEIPQNEEERLEVGFTDLTPKAAYPVSDKSALRPGDHVMRRVHGKSCLKHGIVLRSDSDYLDIAVSEEESIGYCLFSWFSEGERVFLVEYEDYGENRRRETLHRVNTLLADAGTFVKCQAATGKNRNNLALLCMNDPQKEGEVKYVPISK